MQKTFPKTLIALDIETTDLSPEQGEVIELAAVLFRDGKILKKYSTLVKPEEKIPTIVTSITNITDEMVADAPAIDEVRDDFAKFVGDYPIVGHNINFDINFLNGSGFKFQNKRYDTWKMAALLLPNLSSHSLESLTSYLKIKHVESHRALDDVLASIDLFNYLIDQIYKVDHSSLHNINKFVKDKKWHLADIFSYIQTKVPKKGTDVKKTGETDKPEVDFTNYKFEKIEKLFTDKEKAKKVIKNFEIRPGQVQLMKRILENQEMGRFDIIGAGPGLGSYLAELLSVIYYSKKNRKRGAITYNSFVRAKQVIENDVETVENIISSSFHWTYLDNREKYLCRRRFELIKNKKKHYAPEIVSIVKILLWIDNARFGVFDEMAWTFEDRPIEDKINCSEKYCSKKDCKYYEECFYYNALNQAKKSDLVIANHNSLITNQDSEEPVVIDNLVVDEAHELEKYLSSSFDQFVGAKGVQKKLSFLDKNPGYINILKDFKGVGDKIEKNLELIEKNTTVIKDKATLFFGILGIFVNKYKIENRNANLYAIKINNELREYSGWDKVEKSARNFISDLNNYLFDLDKLIKLLKLKKYSDIKADFLGLYRDLYEISKNLENSIVANEKKSTIVLGMDEPYLSVSSEKYHVAFAHTLERMNSVSLLSSVVKNEKEVKYFKKNYKLSDTFANISIDPHYQYDKQVKIVAVSDMANPADHMFNKESEDMIANIVEQVQGRTLVAMGSKASIKQAYKDMSIAMKEKGYKVLAMGASGGGAKLMGEFMDNPKTVFLATNDFIEEAEFPEKSLKCIIIHKIPFDYRSFQKSEGDPEGFVNIVLPEAVTKFKILFQKLIRSSKDKGMFVILDNRVEKMGYGADFIRSLPATNVEYSMKNKVANIIKNWFK